MRSLTDSSSPDEDLVTSRTSLMTGFVKCCHSAVCAYEYLFSKKVVVVVVECDMTWLQKIKTWQQTQTPFLYSINNAEARRCPLNETKVSYTAHMNKYAVLRLRSLKRAIMKSYPFRIPKYQLPIRLRPVRLLMALLA